jgi:DNA-directed RNA polymerase subunit RPC12/RpoP
MTDVKIGTCPLCNGTGHMPCPDQLRSYGQRNGWYGYRAADDTVSCNNCGGQYMFSKPMGKVRLRPDGTPCVHEYNTSQGSGRYTTDYKCIHCGDKFVIDSGD